MGYFKDGFFLSSGETPEEHSGQVDQDLGYRIDDIELGLLERARTLDPDGDMGTWGRRLHEGSQTWVGLHPQVLNTPYEELHRMCALWGPAPDSHLVDLGAGYGRLGFVLREHEPLAHYTGIECVPERVDEANRMFAEHGCERARMVLGNLFAEGFTLPMADCYLIYDYGNIEHIRWTMGQLQNLADVHRFRVIARGDGIRSLVRYAHPWLLEVPGGEEANFSVYANHAV